MVISRHKKANRQGTQSVQKPLLLLIEYADLRRPYCRHRRQCVSSLIARATRMARKCTNIENPRAGRAEQSFLRDPFTA